MPLSQCKLQAVRCRERLHVTSFGKIADLSLLGKRERVVRNASDGLRAQKSARAAGCHPGVLKDPEVRWFKGRSLFVSAGCPSLAVSPLTGHAERCNSFWLSLWLLVRRS